MYQLFSEGRLMRLQTCQGNPVSRVVSNLPVINPPIPAFRSAAYGAEIICNEQSTEQRDLSLYGIEMQFFSKPITRTAPYHQIANSYRQTTGHYQQITGIYMTFTIKDVYRYLRFTDKSGLIYHRLPPVMKNTDMPVTW